MSLLCRQLPLLARATPLPASVRTLATSSVGCNHASPSSSSSNSTTNAPAPAPAPAPANTQAGKECHLPAEQLARLSESIAADLASSAPSELKQRSVRIFRPSKTANSSGKAGTKVWRLDWDILQGSTRWENPLMGWASSGDYMQGTSIKFRTKEDAIHFCEKQGWDYHIQEPKVTRIPPKSYAANYDYNPGKLRIHHTK